jgi:hypothetical protein
MIHERQLVSVSLWDLRAHYEEKLRMLGVAQRVVDAWRATPTDDQRREALASLDRQIERLTEANGIATQLLADLTRTLNEMKARDSSAGD